MAGFTTRINDAVANSFMGRRFRLDGSGHAKTRQHARFLTEIRAGLATFFAMAYIISVNATILSDSGGTCVCNDTTDPTCSTDLDYNLCLGVIRRDFITGTAAISALTSFCMGFFANMPIALAPGMGLNAYFTYTVVGFHGTGPVSYKFALTAVFVEGFVFVALSLLGLRQWLARAIPASIKLASAVGIGLYLTIIGMTYSAGIGAITGATSTPLELAGCLESEIVDSVCPGSAKMRSPMMWVGIFCGGFLTAVLLAYKVKGAIIAGILLVSIISWPRPTSVTYFPYTPVGNDNFDFFKKVVTFHGIEKTLVAQEWNLSGVSGQFGLALITFLYVDILDCTGTLYSMAHFAGAVDPETQDFEGSAVAYLVDALGISIGSLFGLSPVTAFIESGAGISEGGKTGITAMTTGICFFISIFFAPIFASIPPWATGCTLIIVGAMMAKAAKDINWRYFGDALPAFLTLAVMPFTYSIAYGLIAGIISYIVINTITWLIELASGGRIVVPDKELKEPWTWRIKGGLFPSWIVRLSRGKKDFWHDDNIVTSGGTGSLASRELSDGQEKSLHPSGITEPESAMEGVVNAEKHGEKMY
ncbi:related to purine transporter azgA [Phialocephala subalpina]|uniref:Related to purine transporter azgA n=1 Tax=Phialocephala subalpina TaxID=576137 RepID=A0A1L7XPZ4_9HELO|nr:related to purine transporter azgA [Phialocephala subalpina]